MTVDPLVERMRAFGTTIFTEMSALAARTGSINLGQGFPDTDGPPEMLVAAAEALRGGANQYPPLSGIPLLREAITTHEQRFWGLTRDPDTEVVVTAGATEAVAAAILGLCEAGDEVVCFEHNTLETRLRDRMDLWLKPPSNCGNASTTKQPRSTA